MLHKAWSSIEEVLYCFLGSSIKFQGHTGWNIDDLNTIWVRLLGRLQLSNPSDLPCYTNIIFSCDQAALWMVFSVRLSVCLSVRLSVRLSHLFDYVPIIVSSWNSQELSHWTRERSMQKVKVRGQRSRSQRSRPKFSFPDCNSSLNSHMMMKWYIKLDVA